MHVSLIQLIITYFATKITPNSVGFHNWPPVQTGWAIGADEKQEPIAEDNDSILFAHF